MIQASAQGVQILSQVPPKLTDSSQNFFSTQSRMYLQDFVDKKLLAVLDQKLSILKNVVVFDVTQYHDFRESVLAL